MSHSLTEFPSRDTVPEGGEENGKVPEHYPLTSTPLSRPAQRTIANIHRGDVVLMLSRLPIRDGVRSSLVPPAQIGHGSLSIPPARTLLFGGSIRVQKSGGEDQCGGPQESEDPGIQQLAEQFMGELVQALTRRRVMVTPTRWFRAAWTSRRRARG